MGCRVEGGGSAANLQEPTFLKFIFDFDFAWLLKGGGRKVAQFIERYFEVGFFVKFLLNQDMQASPAGCCSVDAFNFQKA